MSTINYTKDENVITGDVLVEWNGLSLGDDGQVFDCRGLLLKSYTISQPVGGGVGNVSIEASVQASPSVYQVIGSGTNVFGKNTDAYASAIYCHISSGSANPVNVALLFRRA